MGGRVPKSSVKTIVLFILMTNYTLNCKWLKISSKSTKYLENSFIFMVLESNIQFPLKFFRGYSMLKDKIIMILGQSEAFVVCRYFPLLYGYGEHAWLLVCQGLYRSMMKARKKRVNESKVLERKRQIHDEAAKKSKSKKPVKHKWF